MLSWCASYLQECCSAARISQLQRHMFDVLLFWLAGRLLCDTYLGARELLREVDYTMTTLARIHLGQNRSDLAAADVAGRPFAPSDMCMHVSKECRQAAARAGIVNAFKIFATLDAHRKEG